MCADDDDGSLSMCELKSCELGESGIQHLRLAIEGIDWSCLVLYADTGLYSPELCRQVESIIC